MSFIVVSFYTEQTPYEKEVKNLIASLDRLGIAHSVKGIAGLGSWEKNCQHKAKVILDALDTSDDDVVWLDADAVVRKYPVLFEKLDCDIAYHYLGYRRELLSGTLFLKNNEPAKALVKQWIELNGKNINWDQKNLQQVVERSAGLKKYMLPATYCKIYDNRMQDAADPVITHYQASRRFKKVIGSARNK